MATKLHDRASVQTTMVLDLDETWSDVVSLLVDMAASCAMLQDPRDAALTYLAAA